MAELTDAQFKQKVVDVLDEIGANINNAGDVDVISSLTEWNRLANSITLPGIEIEQAEVKRYVAAPLSYFAQYAENEAVAVRNSWQAWFGEDPSDSDEGSGIRKVYANWLSLTQDDWDAWFGTAPTEQSEGNGVKKEWATLKTDALAATSAANTASGNVQTAIDTANTAAQNADVSRQRIEQNESTRQQNEQTRQSQEQTRQSQETVRVNAETLRVQQASSDHTRAESDHTQATTDHSTAQGDHNRAEQDHTTANTDHQTASGDHTRAETDHTQSTTDHTTATADHEASVAATEEASNVNAEISGMTVTITNRRGVSSSVNIGFEIYSVYGSVAAMNADAANVPAGKFVMIATTDMTSEENARLYGKNASGGFTFLSDLDQASSSAWADWLDNKKPEIDGRISTADSDHTRAEGDHSTAATDHTAASTDHQTAVTDHTIADGDHDTAVADYAQATTDHTRAESDHTTASTDHTTASDDHAQAGDDHTQASQDHETSAAQSNYAKAQGDHAKEQGDRCEVLNDHPQEIRSDGYIWAWDEQTAQMVNTLRRIVATLDISLLTEQQKQDLVNMFVLDLATATEGQQTANGTITLDSSNQDKVVSLTVLAAFRTVIYGYITAEQSARQQHVTESISALSQSVEQALATKQDNLTFAKTATCTAAAAEISFGS